MTHRTMFLAGRR